MGQLRDEISKKEAELAKVKQTMEHQGKELELMNEELGTAKEANSRAPTTTMKNLVERLKNQLALKEKQHQVIVILLHFCMWEILHVLVLCRLLILRF